MNQTAERHYTGERGRIYHEGKRGIPKKAFPWVAGLRAEKLRGDVAPGDVVLEFGAGYGWNLARLQCARKLACDLTDLIAPELKGAGIEFVPETKDLADGMADVL